MNGHSMSNNREIDLVREAQTIIDSYALTLSRISRRKKSPVKKPISEKTLWFFAGITTSAAIFLAIFLKIY